MNISTISLVLRTTCHLQFSQLAARAKRMALRKCGRHVQSAPAAAPLLADDCPNVPVFHTACSRGKELIVELEKGELCQLNETRHLGQNEVDWRLGAVTRDRLWAITLHYHQWLYELCRVATAQTEFAERATKLLQRYLSSWLRDCDLSKTGAVDLAWNPYAIATRLSWSIRSHQLLQQSKVKLPDALAASWQESLWQQAAYLHSNLEWDLRANHLLRDAVGLAWAGRFFVGTDATTWLQTATKIAVHQANEQVLPDGGHFERSPLYHLEVMDDWLALAILLSDDSARERMRATWQRMAQYSVWMRYPDGTIAQFNDGTAVCADEHLHAGCALGYAPVGPSSLGGKHFNDSGVVVWHGTPWSLFFDVGEIGPDYQPGHAHADTLTVECSVDGQRLFVDPGCHSYDNDDRRRYDRATASHNTVCIDGADSSEVWHIFRVGRRARPRGVAVEIRHHGVWAIAEHDGYDHLPGRPWHRREVSVGDHKALIVEDSVTGLGSHHVEGGYLLEPGWNVESVAGGWRLKCGSTTLNVLVESARELQLTVEARPVHPDYGIEIETNRLNWRYEGPLPLSVRVSAERV